MYGSQRVLRFQFLINAVCLYFCENAKKDLLSYSGIFSRIPAAVKEKILIELSNKNTSHWVVRLKKELS